MATVTCHTQDCVNAEIPIDVGARPTDPETGAPVTYVVCGACNQPITDVVEAGT
jgi:hypothetical protein